VKEFFAVYDMASGEEKRRGVVPEGRALDQPVAEGEELRVLTRDEYLAGVSNGSD
jgi:hypothetical protein